MSMFAGLPKGVFGGAVPDSRTPKLEGPTNAHLRIRCLRHKISENDNTEGWSYYHLDVTVLLSDNPKHPENETRTISVNFPPVSSYTVDPGTSAAKKKTNDHILRGIGSLKAIKAAATGGRIDDVTEADLEEMTANPYFLMDKELVVEASAPQTSNNPNARPWYRYNYFPATPEEISRVAALAAKGGAESSAPVSPAVETPDIPDLPA